MNITKIEAMTFDNTVTAAKFDTSKKSLPQLRALALELAEGADIRDFCGFEYLGQFKNCVGDNRKNTMLIDLFDQALKLLVTNQTTAPTGSDTTPTTGIIYTAGSAQQILRRVANPYRICYQISDDTANGLWGSLVWTDSLDIFINRVRVPIQKKSGESVFIELRASLI